MRISPELKAGMFTSRTINFFVLRFMGYRKAISDEFYKDWPAIQRICLERNLHLNQTINLDSLLIKLIGKSKTLNIFYTFHHYIILVFFICFQLTRNGRVVQCQYLRC